MGTKRGPDNPLDVRQQPSVARARNVGRPIRRRHRAPQVRQTRMRAARSQYQQLALRVVQHRQWSQRLVRLGDARPQVPRDVARNRHAENHQLGRARTESQGRQGAGLLPVASRERLRQVKLQSHSPASDLHLAHKGGEGGRVQSPRHHVVQVGPRRHADVGGQRGPQHGVECKRE